MKFVEHGLTPAHYRWKFLQYTDQIAPEVLQTLKSLCPKYDLVINGYPFSKSLTEKVRSAALACVATPASIAATIIFKPCFMLRG